MRERGARHAEALSRGPNQALIDRRQRQRRDVMRPKRDPAFAMRSHRPDASISSPNTCRFFDFAIALPSASLPLPVRVTRSEFVLDRGAQRLFLSRRQIRPSCFPKSVNSQIC